VHALLATVPAIAGVLPTLLFVGMVLAGVLGAMTMISGNRAYDEIGRGGLSMQEHASGSGESVDDEPAPIGADARELEIRQMLQARNARIVRQGGEPLDVETELSRLIGGGGAVDSP
jgi:hypothetical protein